MFHAILFVSNLPAAELYLQIDGTYVSVHLKANPMPKPKKLRTHKCYTFLKHLSTKIKLVHIVTKPKRVRT